MGGNLSFIGVSIMNCPKCGNRLQLNEGAYCDACMAIVNENLRLEKKEEIHREIEKWEQRKNEARATIDSAQQRYNKSVFRIRELENQLK